MFKIPYSMISIGSLERKAHKLMWVGESMQDFFPFLRVNLKKAKIGFSLKEYLSMCFLSSIIFFVFCFALFTGVLFFAGIQNSIMIALLISVIATFFVFFQQVTYPSIFANKRIKDIERNLMDSLQNILIQLDSGVPLFDIIVNISKSEYGEISSEFEKVVKEINSGKSQTEALEEMVASNPSLLFRRSIWQIINGIKSGADLSTVIKENISTLSEEQVLQIQKYGAQLNPFAMFYMLMVVIVPSLGMTFLIILSSLMSFSETIIKFIFVGMFGMVMFFQIMFIGLIKSKRPNLLGG